MTTEEQIHTNAAALILSAAGKSGLLDEVAKALCFFNTTPNPSAGCRACALRDALVGAFDECICTPAIAVESFHGEGVSPPPFGAVELMSYVKHD